MLCSSASVNLCDTVPDKWLYGSRGKKAGLGLKRTGLEPFIQPLYEQRSLDDSLSIQTLSWISREINPRFKSPFIQKAPRVRKGARDCVTARSAACCGPASRPGPPTLPGSLCFLTSQVSYCPLCRGEGGFLVAQIVKNLPAMQETLVRSLGWEDPLEKEMETHSSHSCLGNPMDRRA